MSSTYDSTSFPWIEKVIPQHPTRRSLYQQPNPHPALLAYAEEHDQIHEIQSQPAGIMTIQH